MLLLDGLGYGLSAKPDLHYTLALQADLAAAFVAELGLTRLALLTHDVGDTVGGELLARRAEGSWPVEVTRRVITNGSIYIEQAHLTNGQQLLLSLPDEKLSSDAPIDAASLRPSLRDTFSPAASVPPEGSRRATSSVPRWSRSCATTGTWFCPVSSVTSKNAGRTRRASPGRSIRSLTSAHRVGHG